MDTSPEFSMTLSASQLRCEKDKSGYIDYQQFAKRLAKESPSGGASGSHAVSVMQADFCAPELRRLV